MNEWVICREVALDAAHRVPDDVLLVERRLHGHRFTVAATCIVDEDDPRRARLGTDLAEVMHTFVMRFHHRTLLYHLDPLFLFLSCDGAHDGYRQEYGTQALTGDDWGIDGMEFVPSIENLAQYFADTIARTLRYAVRVGVRDSPTTGATAETNPAVLDEEVATGADRRSAHQ